MFYLIYKPKGISSFSCIRDFARQHKIKKIGHTGTLDPLASGLLLVATDEETKLISYVANKNKTYITTIQFGKATSTYDSEGDITDTSTVKIKSNQVHDLLNWLSNQTTQIPPIFSAKKVDGVRSYDLARKNKAFQLKSQKISVNNVKLIDFDEKKQQLTVELSVSNGTYIRSLANDLGLAFGTVSFMLELERIEISGLHKNLLSKKNYIAIINVLPLVELGNIIVNNTQLELLSKGQIIDINADDGTYLLTSQNTQDMVLGIIVINQNKAKVKKLFGNRLFKKE
ncbi:tRNA pseudouridine(55) synthase TruB [Mycoplasma zalophidermidis]|uniref:tRNA pseudouridine(55) synthase TruB n=1 Tax=Mycoplasma zalophidermidis TaxID=398174 RepID=UPI001C11C222|nr:tRNA pseudouridine(55) synthase TruB [Mycoplasma zalophidermidis]MBU4689878.1 tRNA pseudouridine(55) synthase TruB [Mycoplasma zalophidermidis]MCR8966748.1 tRNA pseudouridine(55) synthase TruB [Mycoplasma zalophidermidis]